MGRHFPLGACMVSIACLNSCLAVPRRVIIDQDTTGPGGTNTVSIAVLLQAVDIQIEGITVASGDGWVGEEVMHEYRVRKQDESFVRVKS